MAQQNTSHEVREAAAKAIDMDETREVLRTASGEDPSDEAVEALHGAMVEETAELVSRASRRARRRGRAVDGEDIGHVADSRFPSNAGRGRGGNHSDVRQAALRAVDEQETRRMFRTASGEDPSEAAVTGLRETIADEIADLALDASRHVRRRGRGVEGDDVGQIVDQRYEQRYAPMKDSYFRD